MPGGALRSRAAARAALARAGHARGFRFRNARPVPPPIPWPTALRA
jgi:hypothetical protein